MEIINGSTVVPRSDSPEPTTLGPSETAGAYVALIGVFPPDAPAPPLHTHPHTDELFLLAEGDATFQLGDREVALAPGGVVFVPRGTPHTVRNSGDTLVRGTILISPGDAEHLFEPVDPAP